MPFRQLASVLIALIVIMGAALFVITRGEGDPGRSAASTSVSSTTTTTLLATVVTTAQTTVPTTTIPTGCAAPATTGAPATTLDTTTTAQPNEDTTAAPTLEAKLGPNASVSTVGLSYVTFGLTVKQAEIAAGTPMTPCEPVSDCYRVTPLEAPKGISFVVDAGTIERVDITEGPITTRSGLGIGTSEKRIVDSLGDKLDRKVNDDGSIDLIFVPTDPNDADFRIIFTIRDGSVDTFRAGRIPLVLPTRACT